MIDHILGRPSPTLRRSQIFLVIFFWVWRLYKGDGAPRPIPSSTRSAIGSTPSSRIGAATATASTKTKSWIWRLWVALVGRRMVAWMSKVNEKLQHFTPYQLILGTLTFIYALRHLDDLLGIGAPEPLAKLYSRSYYRATYVNTAFDAGFSSAMSVRPKWLRDICSMAFTGYYLVWATEGDEVLRRFRAVCTVEMLRTTWEKTNNPYIRLITTLHRPRLPIIRTITIPRPPTSSRANLPAVKAMLFFSGSQEEFEKATELVVDYPGGGFIAMGPECHEERLRNWAKRTGKPVISVDYGKAPEYPYPWAIEEGFDAYRTLMETKGGCVGIKSGQLKIVLTGDSAGGNICATIMLRILEHPTGIPKPVSMILAYPALDFNFTSWMSPTNLRVLRTEQSETQIPGLLHGKDHLRHKSPLSVVDDLDVKRRRPASGRARQKSWTETLADKLPLMSPMDEKPAYPRTQSRSPMPTGWTRSLPRTLSAKVTGWLAGGSREEGDVSEEEVVSEVEEDSEDEDDTKTEVPDPRREADKSLADRVKTPKGGKSLELPQVDSPMPVDDIPQIDVAQAIDEVVAKKRKKARIGTRLTMTSRVGYFQDRIISPSMMRAMAILYIGPHRNPNFETDYYISPILSPPRLLAHFPPVYLICGERDPFVDDTVIFAGKIREAKRARRAQAEAASHGHRHSESLKMPPGQPNGHTAIPDHIVRETDDDWVQMRIIEGWGHGFMQMSSLMREVDPVLLDMADWIDESFANATELAMDIQEVAAAHAAAKAAFQPDAPVLLSPEDHLAPSHSMHVKPVRNYDKSPIHTPVGGSDLGGAYVGDDESDDDHDNDNLVTFTPKNKGRKRPPPSRFNPVPRRPSKESLHRSLSAPKFDVDETGSSGEAMIVKTPPLGLKSLPREVPKTKGSGAFAFFGSNRGSSPAKINKTTSNTPVPGGIGIYGLPRSMPGTESRAHNLTEPSTKGTSTPSNAASEGNSSAPATAPDKHINSLVAAAVAGARAASPALAAAGFAPQSVGNVSEAELMRRRRREAVFGIGTGEGSHENSEDEDDER